MDEVAELYVRLVLELGLYDPDYIDFYIGPKNWKPTNESKKESFPYQELRMKVDQIKYKLTNLGFQNHSKEFQCRFKSLQKQITAVASKIDMLSGKKRSFDEQSRLMYDSKSPVFPENYFENIHNKLNRILPGNGQINARFKNFQRSFQIPVNKTKILFETAINESRSRTRKYINLPRNETVIIEPVTKKPWGAYNWYKGNNHSVIQINVDKPRTISIVTHLACHEAYPGHHVFHLIQEKKLFRKNGWVEYSVYPLHSPQSLISEGTAEYGTHLAFPNNEKTEFEKEILFALAGFDTSCADFCNQVFELIFKLRQVRIEVARKYLDNKISKTEAIDQLITYQFLSKTEAEWALLNMESVQSYLISYSVGYSMVKNHIEQIGSNKNSHLKKWKAFQDLLSKPIMPSDLS